MMALLTLLFIVVPAVEIALLIEVGDRIGGWNTLLVIIATGVLGAALARNEGLIVLERIRRVLEQGRMPQNEIVDGLLILVAGVMLLPPGFVTDALGLLILLPVTRPLFRRFVLKRLEERIIRIDQIHPPGPPEA